MGNDSAIPLRCGTFIAIKKYFHDVISRFAQELVIIEFRCCWSVQDGIAAIGGNKLSAEVRGLGRRLSFLEVACELTQLASIQAYPLVTRQQKFLLLICDGSHAFDGLDIARPSLTFLIASIKDFALLDALHTFECIEFVRVRAVSEVAKGKSHRVSVIQRHDPAGESTASEMPQLGAVARNAAPAWVKFGRMSSLTRTQIFSPTRREAVPRNRILSR